MRVYRLRWRVMGTLQLPRYRWRDDDIIPQRVAMATFRTRDDAETYVDGIAAADLEQIKPEIVESRSRKAEGESA